MEAIGLNWTTLGLQTHASRRRTIYDAPYEEGEKGGGRGQMASSGGVSPVRTLPFPSPTHSAFSLYRRPLVPNSPGLGGARSSEVECSSSPAVVFPTITATTSRTSSGVSAAEGTQHPSPRRNYEHHSSHHHHYHAAMVRGPFKATSTTSPSNENLVLEPRPNPTITHVGF